MTRSKDLTRTQLAQALRRHGIERDRTLPGYWIVYRETDKNGRPTRQVAMPDPAGKTNRQKLAALIRKRKQAVEAYKP